MQKLSIAQRTPDLFGVTIHSKTTTTHHVTVTDKDLHTLTGGKASKKELLKFSFAFLLEREPNSSILPAFEITLIGNYFPEYKREVKEKFC